MNGVEPKTFFEFMVILSFMLNVVSVIMVIVRGGSSQKREVKINEEAVNQHFFEKAMEENKESHQIFHSKIENGKDFTLQQVQALRGEIMKSVEAVHERINEVLAAVSRLEGKK